MNTTLPLQAEAERQTAAWAETMTRAHVVADQLRAEFGEREGLTNVQVLPDARVLVGIHVTHLWQWVRWCEHLTITDDRVSDIVYASVGEGHRDGVAVGLVAQDVPEVRARHERLAARPYRYGGEVYDLGLPYRDMSGVVWYHHGQSTAEGMPLLAVDGRAERCTLANVVEIAGPLTPVMGPVTAVTAEAGEAA